MMMSKKVHEKCDNEQLNSLARMNEGQSANKAPRVEQ